MDWILLILIYNGTYFSPVEFSTSAACIRASFEISVIQDSKRPAYCINKQTGQVLDAKPAQQPKRNPHNDRP